ncbi:MAG TPA: hypothetical protein PLM29_07405 [Deltaproteobacteria bacterium]|nr:hypothetical protein [Deltaproteobacteria bacterium]
MEGDRPGGRTLQDGVHMGGRCDSLQCERILPNLTYLSYAGKSRHLQIRKEMEV